MSTRSVAGVTLLLTSQLFTAAGESADDGLSPALGRPAAPELIERWNIDIATDGTGLPPGQGHSTQGKRLYEELCSDCHGPRGIGASADALASGDSDLTGEWPDKTIGSYWPYATSLFDFIRRAKPMASPGSLQTDEIYALTAYLLALNGILGEESVLDATTLRGLRMPNRAGFVDCHPLGGSSPACAP